MRYRIICCCFFFFISNHLLFAQPFYGNNKIHKPVIDTGVLANWSWVDWPSISSDGAYAMYYILQERKRSPLIEFRSTKNNWNVQYSCSDIVGARFTTDSKIAIFKTDNESLCLLTLGSDKKQYIAHVKSYKLLVSKNGEFLLYQLEGEPGELILVNLKNKVQRKFSSIIDYAVSDNGSSLVLKTLTKKDTLLQQVIQWVDLPVGNPIIIGRGEDAGNFTFDISGKQLCFLAKKSASEDAAYSLWYYEAGNKWAVEKASASLMKMGSGLTVANRSPLFSKDGRHIFFFYQQKKAKLLLDENTVSVDIWHYADRDIQPKQLSSYLKFYMATVNLNDGEIIQLEQPGDYIRGHFANNEIGNFVILKSDKNAGQWWDTAHGPSVSLLSILDGSRILLQEYTLPSDAYCVSPHEKYVISYDSRKQSYFSYEISTGITRNLTGKIPVSMVNNYNESVVFSNHVFNTTGMPAAAWLNDDDDLIIYDNYDVWQLDPLCVKDPVNLTNGYGKTHYIKFRLVEEGNKFKLVSLNGHSGFLFTAFDSIHKYNGFYYQKVGSNYHTDPILLAMGPYLYHYESSQFFSFLDFPRFSPVKAAKSDKWIVQRMSAVEGPNYYITEDFKQYHALSHLHPQKAYNWLTTELVRWETQRGDTCEGILYKPENFDPRKKYPIIFNYYELASGGLYGSLKPGLSCHTINIPYFVSNGYIVFVPDIHLKRGEPGESAVNSVVTAAKYLAQMPWVDSTRMGLQGHSFGGYETNYLVTHSHLFAAAVASSGMSDLISFYGDPEPLYGEGQAYCEFSQGHLGVCLGQNPEAYIKNSPVFKAGQVTTPLLLINNRQDPAVTWKQGVEFYLALRRLEKKVWLLQYDNGGHGVLGKDAMDYTIRMKQFFDHYLKGAPAPKWMTNGIPANLKGIDKGYEL